MDIDALFTSFLNSPASTFTSVVIVLILVVKGILMPRWWVDRLLKAKDETISALTKELDDLNKAAPIVVKIMEELNHQAGQKKIERRDSGDYDA